MKKYLGLCLMMVVMVSGVCSQINAQEAPGSAYNFGDFSSSTLATKAWDALNSKDLDGVLVYTNKCIALYAAKAQEMQKSLKDYPKGSNADIFKFWALNDVATSYFIQGKAFRNAGKNNDAIKAYKEVVNNYSYGQCWDKQGWFWKPAEAAQKELAEMGS